MKESNEVLFILVCAVFTAVMLVLSMYKSAELAATNEDIGRLRSCLESAERENRQLTVSAEIRLNLNEIEKYAKEELGMSSPGAGQIEYIDFLPDDHEG